MFLASALLIYLTLGLQTVFAAFGVTSSGGYYVVDAGSANALVFKVRQTNCDITSLLFRGTEVSPPPF